MKKLIASLIAGLLCAGSALADDANNKKCPVSGKDVDAAVTSTVSVTIGFCCSKCQGKFGADTKAQEDALKKYAGSKDSPANKKCVYNASKDAKADNGAAAFGRRFNGAVRKNGRTRNCILAIDLNLPGRRQLA